MGKTAVLSRSHGASLRLPAQTRIPRDEIQDTISCCGRVQAPADYARHENSTLIVYCPSLQYGREDVTCDASTNTSFEFTPRLERHLVSPAQPFLCQDYNGGIVKSASSLCPPHVNVKGISDRTTRGPMALLCSAFYVTLHVEFPIEYMYSSMQPPFNRSLVHRESLWQSLTPDESTHKPYPNSFTEDRYTY